MPTRRIAVLGAGQAGLLLALGLARHGHEVTLVTDRTAEEIRGGRVLSTQCMFDEALEVERELGLGFWEDECPTIGAVRFTIGSRGGARPLQFAGTLDGYAQSVDQRIKMAGWLEELGGLGASIVHRDADLDLLEVLASEHDLVVVGSAKGELGRMLDVLFERDPARSPYSTPQRQLAVAYVRGLDNLEAGAFSISIIPGVGECFIGPALTLDGPCSTICFEARPESELDRFRDPELDDLDRYLARCLELLERFFPWESERVGRLELTDAGGVLKGALTPVVREGVGRLPSGAAVLGIGDAVVLNDPLVGQGANNAAKGGAAVLREITARGAEPFDVEWMHRAAAVYWERVRYSTLFTNLMLSPPKHIGSILSACAERQTLANWLANGTNDPATLFPWITMPDGGDRLLAMIDRKIVDQSAT
jgi:2-polyprenyl-6-methoxyphenol hydroxylase-like FAD-dependent oxidoreductase